MINQIQKLLLALTLFSFAVTSRSQVTTFTYQGRLIANGTPANGSYDLQFSLRDAAVAGSALANTNTISAVAVNNGLFTVALDFGSLAFTSSNRWLEIGVRTNGGGAFVTLTPRQPLTAAPYAITAINLAGVVANNTNSGNNATVSGGLQNTSSGVGATVGGGRHNTSSYFDSTVGGGINNTASGSQATVGGGEGNTATNPFTTVSGGVGNSSSGWAATVGGGSQNASAGDFATVSGGFQNTNSGTAATVSGGFINASSGNYATVGGGGSNQSAGAYSTVAGGAQNTGSGLNATVGGGLFNSATNAHATVPGGASNLAGGQFSFAVGYNNTAAGYASSVGGGQGNRATGTGSVVGGGGIDGPNTYANVASGNASVVAGGILNTAAGLESTVSGGVNNFSGGDFAMIPGGEFNTAGGHHSFAAGQRARANHGGTFVWADATNTEFPSTGSNQFLIRASGGVGIGTPNPSAKLHLYSTDNPTAFRIQSTGTPGFGRVEFVSNPQGDASEWRPGYIQSTDNGGFTGGLAFNVNGTGAASKFGNVEVMRIVNGRVGIGTNNPQSALHVLGEVRATSFNPPSDRNLKENFTPVSPREVLGKVALMPISRWNFKGDAATPHVGPMAQDFHAAFGLGTDNKHIATVDADGVALAAIQGLNQKVEEKDAEIQELKGAMKELKASLDKLTHSSLRSESSR
jgi:hypothetical protein